VEGGEANGGAETNPVRFWRTAINSKPLALTMLVNIFKPEENLKCSIDKRQRDTEKKGLLVVLFLSVGHSAVTMSSSRSEVTL
jgi:hypothetical protein